MTGLAEMIVTWFNTYGLIPTILIIIAIIGFFIKLRNDVNYIKKLVEEHPLLIMFKDWETKKGGYEFFNSILKDSNVEKNKD